MTLRSVLLFVAAASFVQQTPARPQFRLGDGVKPVRYALDLTLVPEEETFSGTATVDLDVKAATAVLWLNAGELTIESARLSANGATLAARPLPGDDGFVGFQFEKPVPAGKATLRVTYNGQVHSKSSNGIFRNQDLDRWYIYTQFEAIEARTAFPCFDEPGFKTPWQLTVHVKKDHSAFSNTPVVAESDEGNGFKTVRFAETKPLASYQVAFAVGPFETVDAGTVGRKRTALRVIVPKGRSAETAWAVEATGSLLVWLEDYFETAYPYEKLDSIAVPLFGGAMENPGLITYSQPLILSKRAEDTIDRRRSYASLAAHEMAHLWFGDLVTTAWWDDLWLNEGFATWMAGKAVAAWKPEWDYGLENTSDRLHAMNADSLITARKIRQPVENGSDVANAFDGITYGKAAAVIHMFEQYLGPDTFRKGVKAYLDRHAHGNATASDFLRAFSSAAGSDIAPAFSTFLDQAGVPQVAVDLKCESGSAPVLALSQKRYLPLGSPRPDARTWQIPVCAEYGSGSATTSECGLLREQAGELLLKQAKACPDSVLLNHEYNGYYRSQYSADLLNRLLADPARIDAAERLGVIRDLHALARSGDVPYSDALALVPRFAGDPKRAVVEATAEIAASIHEHLVPDEIRPNYARLIQTTYGDRARNLGWTAKPGEDDDSQLLRKALVGLVAREGDDAALREEARRLAQRWLDDRTAVQPEMVGTVLNIAARDGSRDLWEQLRAKAQTAKDEHERRQLLGAMGSFKDPAIVKANFDLIANQQFDMREALGLLFEPMQHRETRDAPYTYVTANYDAVASSMPGAMGMDFKAFLPYVGAGFCSTEKSAEVDAFFKPRMANVTGGPRTLAQVLEVIQQCDALRTRQQAAVAEFLQKY